jgi:hypothetical protein
MILKLFKKIKKSGNWKFKMFSIYSSAFNVIKNSFDYESAVENFCNFAEEVVIAVNKSEDNSFEAFKDLEKKFINLKIISVDFDYSDPLLDGKIKNAALQKTSNIYKIGLDLDERIPKRHKDRWIRAAKMMYEHPMIYGFLIPSIDIWKSLEYIQADPNKNKNFKWYLHKEKLYRGAVNFARLENGKIDREKSDTCELLDQLGNLVNTPKIYANFENDEDYFKWLEEEAIFVFHIGFLDFEKRIIRNKNFWNKHWETVSGKKHETAMTLEQFDKRSTKLKKHNLKLWDEV